MQKNKMQKGIGELNVTVFLNYHLGWEGGGGEEGSNFS